MAYRSPSGCCGFCFDPFGVFGLGRSALMSYEIFCAVVAAIKSTKAKVDVVLSSIASSLRKYLEASVMTVSRDIGLNSQACLLI